MIRNHKASSSFTPSQRSDHGAFWAARALAGLAWARSSLCRITLLLRPAAGARAQRNATAAAFKNLRFDRPQSSKGYSRRSLDGWTGLMFVVHHRLPLPPRVSLSPVRLPNTPAGPGRVRNVNVISPTTWCGALVTTASVRPFSSPHRADDEQRWIKEATVTAFARGRDGTSRVSAARRS